MGETREFDYVIVGAGSAGCVLAARLTEDPDVSVCLLEAGPPDTKEGIHVPVGFLKLGKTDVDWDLSTAPEPFLDARRVYLPRGRTYGGSSSLNAMIYIRGNPLDYDGWGVEGWGWDDLLPYFLRSEGNERGASELHGADGPLTVSEGRSRNPSMDAWVAAAREAGIPANDDFNGARQEGSGLYQLTQRDGMRCSAAVAYLHPALARTNLTVEPWRHVHRVVIEGGRAVGVEASQLADVTTYRAAREVILAAGAYQSPQLLQLSGIGPAELLAAREVEVLVDQPLVGQNLQDHLQVSLVWSHDEEVSLIQAATPEALAQFEGERTGPLTSNLAEAGAFLRVDPDAPAPDLQFHAAPVQVVDEGQGDPTEHGIWVAPGLLQPESTGSVMINSADPTGKPVIRHNYLAAEQDMETLVAGVRLALDIAGRPALERYTRRPFLVPGGDDDESIRQHIRRNVVTIYHPVGTCAIGSVVDAQLRVEGVEGLRVCDASVMPKVPRGNTNAPTIAIAERAADLLRGREPLRRGAQAAAVA